MKRKEWIWALITDDRVCCLSALWSQSINIRVGKGRGQNLNRLIARQLKSQQGRSKGKSKRVKSTRRIPEGVWLRILNSTMGQVPPMYCSCDTLISSHPLYNVIMYNSPLCSIIAMLKHVIQHWRQTSRKKYIETAKKRALAECPPPITCL